MTQEQFKKASQYWNNKEQIPVPEKELKKTVEETTAMGEKFEPFMHTSLLLAPFISLEFVSSEYYSLADFDKHEKTTRFEEEMYDETKPYVPPETTTKDQNND